MTAPSQAANISVTAATVKVGLAASVAAMATSKTALISLATAGLITAGSVAVGPLTDNINPGPQPSKAQSLVHVPHEMPSHGDQECWYYYPPNGNGAVMMRLMSGAKGNQQSYCQWLQSDQANYYRRENRSFCFKSRN